MDEKYLPPESIETEEDFTAWFGGLPDEIQSEVSRALSGAPRIGPNPGPQTDAFRSKAYITGYGGSAGGGKSALIGLLSLESHRRTVIFRKDAKQIRALVDDLVEFSGTDFGLNRNAGVFRIPETHNRPARMIEWGGIGEPGSEQDWRGRPHDLFCVDEATEVSMEKIKFLLTWNRSTTKGQRVRVLLTFNPPGGPDDIGGGSGRWVIDFFAPWLDERHPNPAKPGELRYFYVDERGKEVETLSGAPFPMKLQGEEFIVEPQSRTFIPARVHDNPYLMGTNYEKNLLTLEEPYRSQMLLGDFRSGVKDSEYQVIPTAWIDEAMSRWSVEGRREKMSAIGLDVARGGRDSTVLARRHGWWWDKLIRVPGKDSPDGHFVAGLAMQHARDGAQINIDSLGVGASPFDILTKLGANVYGVKSSKQRNLGLPKMEQQQDFGNLRSALWWVLRKILDPANGFTPSLPKDNRLRSELLSPYYKIMSGKWTVEAKSDTKKRLGHSPDDADSVVYSVMNAFDTEGSERLNAKHRKKKSDGYYTRSIKKPCGWMGH